MKNYKTIFAVLISLLTIVIFYWFFYVLVINRNNYSKIKEDLIVAENNFKRLSSERANFKTIKNTREKQTLNFDTLKVHIPLKKNVKGSNSYVETLDIIHKIARKNKVAITVFRPELVNTFPKIEVSNKLLDKKIERYLVEMECNGDYLSIGKYFQELQENERLINLLKFNIETEFSIEGGLNCKVLLYTYVFSEFN
jgi:Tfp pilus assembly protein PilO